jgi:hypothetical protein
VREALDALPPSGANAATPGSLSEVLDRRSEFTQQMQDWSTFTNHAVGASTPKEQRVGDWLQREKAKHQMSKRETQHWEDLSNNPTPTVWTIDWLLSKLTGDQLAGDKLAVRLQPT